jgi:transketolase
MSAADLLAVLVANHFGYDWDNPRADTNDHLIFSKGHASPLLYSVFKATGVIGDEELITGYRRFGQRLEGHPTPILPWVDVATGSLGQGLADGVGVALAGQYLDKLPYKVWVLCGDSEMAEGSIWEALDKSAHYGLSNLVVLVDVNRLGQRGETELGWNVDAYARRVEAFGCTAITIDGHDLTEIDTAFTAAAAATDRPTVILARTIKGKGFSEIEDKEGWHGKALPEDMAARAIRELGGERHLTVRGPLPDPDVAREASPSTPPVERPTYQLGDQVATRRAYGDALAALGSRNALVVALDGEVSNSTFTDEFARTYPGRYFEMFIAEQQLIAAATGLAVRGYIPFASTFAAFLTRAHDFIRMGAVSGLDLRLIGSHAGVEIGADGPSQMALEDLAMMQSVHGSTVFYPSDATSAAALVDEMASIAGISYMRTTRGAYPVLYPTGTHFPTGGSHTLKASDSDQVAIIAAGVTVHEALDAAQQLQAEGISCRVVDCFSIKPLDAVGVADAVASAQGRVIVVEDHHAEGGLGSAVMTVLIQSRTVDIRMVHLAVSGIPGSGTPQELLGWAGIDSAHIQDAARGLLE